MVRAAQDVWYGGQRNARRRARVLTRLTWAGPVVGRRREGGGAVRAAPAAFRDPYLLGFSEHFYEVININTGSIVSIVPAFNLTHLSSHEDTDGADIFISVRTRAGWC